MKPVLTRRAVLAVPAALAACGSPPPPPPPVLDLQVIGGADQNPDQSGKPVAVAVHIYQLGSTAKFERADAFALIEREKQTLGADCPDSEEIVVAPGETRAVNHPLKPDVHFVGIATFFRDIDHATWRGFVPVAANGTTRLVVHITGIKATIAPA